MRPLSFLIILLLLFNITGQIAAQTDPNRFMIDDFETSNPYNNYQVSKGDQSGLSLNTSSDRKSGNYSLEMVYYLKSTLPTGSYVALEKYFKEDQYPDLSDLVKFGVWVKGDGSGNILQIELIDGSDEVWVYENKGVLNSVKWERLSIDLTDLKLSDTSLKNNGVLDAGQIKGYRIRVYNRSSKVVQGQAVKSSQGNILIDDLHAVLKGAVAKVEEEVIEKKPVKKMEEESRINLSGSLYGEFFHVPEENNQLYNTTGEKTDLFHWGKVGFDANYDKISAKFVIASESQEFGNAAYLKDVNEKYSGQVQQNYPEAVIPFIQLRANNLSDYINNITFGNLWFEYNRYTFSPTLGYDDSYGLEKVVPDWGLKGISAEGNLEIIGYHTFIIKQPYESYTYGLRLNRHFGKLGLIEMDYADVKFYYIDAQDTAKFTNDDTVKKSGKDKVYSAEASIKFLQYKVGLEGMYAYNDHSKTGQVDYSVPYEPVYQQALENKVTEKDDAYKAKLILDSLLLDNLYLTYEYRHLGENFKPKYRMEPILFDDIDSDQIGHNALAAYRIIGIQLTGEFDELTRISDSDFYRKRRSGGVGLNMLKNVTLFYQYEWKREYYQYVSTRSSYHTERDDEIVTQEIYMKTQLRYNLDLIMKFRNEDIEWPGEGKEFNNQSVYVKSDYYFSNNLLVFIESRISRFGDSSWYSPGYNPYIDNFVRAGTMFNF